MRASVGRNDQQSAVGWRVSEGSFQVVAEKGSKQIAVDGEPMLKGKPDMACKMMIFAGNKK